LRRGSAQICMDAEGFLPNGVLGVLPITAPDRRTPLPLPPTCAAVGPYDEVRDWPGRDLSSKR